MKIQCTTVTHETRTDFDPGQRVWSDGWTGLGGADDGWYELSHHVTTVIDGADEVTGGDYEEHELRGYRLTKDGQKRKSSYSSTIPGFTNTKLENLMYAVEHGDIKIEAMA